MILAIHWCLNEAEVMWQEKWSKWHATEENEPETLCHRQIPFGGNGCRFVPETDEMLERVDCRQCRRAMVTKKASD